jgi:hypothetical protein
MANNFDLQLKWLNGSQIEVQAQDAESLDGSEKVLIMQGGSPRETTTQDVADLGGGGASYLVYTALLSQSGTDAPVATVLENTLGGEVVWSRGAEGYYVATLADTFTVNKTFFLHNGQGSSIVSTGNDSQPNSVYVQKEAVNPLGAQDGLAEFCLEIRVYP